MRNILRRQQAEVERGHGPGRKPAHPLHGRTDHWSRSGGPEKALEHHQEDQEEWAVRCADFA